MGEFIRVANHFNKMLGEGTGLLVEEILESVILMVGDANCYPGLSCTGCFELAFFISLSSKNHGIGRGHLSFRKALEYLVQHMQGRCAQITRTVIIITDAWDAEAFSDWYANIQQIKLRSSIEAYLITGYSVTRIEV